MNKLILASMVVFSGLTQLTKANNVLDYDSVWNCDRTKVNWYCNKPKEETPVQEVKKETPKQAPLFDPITDLNKLKTATELRAELKKREDIAVMYPTEQNIKNYLDAWHLVQNKATVFTDQWRRVVYQNPDYDYSLRNPSNNAAIKVQAQAKQTQIDGYLKNLSKEQGLIFFFRSDCPYCHQMAPILKQLSQMYGFEVLGVSVDGAGLPDFPNPVDGRAVVQKWGIEKVPATFIASKKTKDHAPIGFGVMSLNEVIERIWVLTNTQPG
ncbi:TPA: conjugal transfer protein TraF, partial [Acinetobacter baumannii]